MIVTFKRYCDKCGKTIADGSGAEVLKHTVNCQSHPTRHLYERCYAEVFGRQIAKEKDGAQ